MGDAGVAYRVYVGVAVAADTFTAAWFAPGGQSMPPFTGEQAAPGFAALARRPQATGEPPGETLVVLEATGDDQVALAVALREAGYRVAAVNPRQAHHLAKARLRRAKTDAPDARDLAPLAAVLRPRHGRRRPGSTTRCGSASSPVMGCRRCGRRHATSATPCCSGRWSWTRCASTSTR